MKDSFVSNMQAGGACAPGDGAALRAAIDGTCTVITLLPGEEEGGGGGGGGGVIAA